MASKGLVQGKRPEIYMMVEIPSNVVLIKEFGKVFDGFSIGSNDLTQLTLGLDRDSALISHIFDERNSAVTELIRTAILEANKMGKKSAFAARRRVIILNLRDFWWNAV